MSSLQEGPHSCLQTQHYMRDGHGGVSISEGALLLRSDAALCVLHSDRRTSHPRSLRTCVPLGGLQTQLRKILNVAKIQSNAKSKEKNMSQSEGDMSWCGREVKPSYRRGAR